MAKLLQPNNTGAAPRRVTLKTSGPAPKATLRLKGADGKAIEPKKSPTPARVEPSAPASAAADEAAAKAAAEEAARKAAEEAAAEEAARKAAEEADRLAQEEYERQMAEYEKQMEEYNRQMAEYQAAEEARLAAEAEEARKAAEAEEARKAAEAAAKASKPAKARLSVAKPAGLKPAGIALKPAGAKKAAAPAPSSASTPEPAADAPAPAPKAKSAPKITSLGMPAAKPKAKVKEKAPAAPEVEEPEEGELSEEELAARAAYLEQLQRQASAPKIWQLPAFKYGCIAFGVLLVGIGIWAYSVNQTNRANEEHRNYINQYLTIAQNLNKQGIESLADVKEKKVDFSCPPEAAKDLLGLVVDPFVKRSDGKNRYGANPEGVAQNACLVLAIAAEQNPEIDKMIFATLGEKCDKMRPSLFSWLLQRMSISNNKGIKGKLKKLARQVSEKPKWKQKAQVLSSVWSCIGLRVTPKDLDEIIALLSDEAIDDQLAKTLSICIGNVLDMMDDPAKRQQVGDEVFDKLPEKYRASLVDSLAKSSSPKALAFYKKEMEDPACWESEGQVRFANAMLFFQFFGNDDIVDYLLELKDKAKDKPALLRAVENSIQGVFAQNRERSDAEAQRLLSLIFDKINEDTSEWKSVISKTDPDAADFIGEDNPGYAKLMERKAELEKCRQQKGQLITALSSLRDYKWVMNLLERYAKDADGDISSKAEDAIDKVRKNTASFIETQSRFKKRSKE